MSKDYKQYANAILTRTVEMKASDLHLAAGMVPHVRVNKTLCPLDLPPLSSEDIEQLAFSVLDREQREKVKTDWVLDFSYSISGVSRFRGSIIRQRGSMDVAFRVIPWEVPGIDELGLPPVVKDLSRLPRGLVLVTGPTGSGKTTTLAGIIGLINEERRANIVTIENPIEFLHKHKKSIVRQQEIGNDAGSFADALRHLLRHDPDVILIGEMRDQESISIAMTAAETGHLVFSTLHSQTAALAVHRIIDAFPEGKQKQVRAQVADTLKGVIAQQVVPQVGNTGCAVAVEVLVNTSAVCNMIREGKEHQLYTAIQTGQKQGMQTMDAALARLCLQGLISTETAQAKCVDRSEIDRLLCRQGVVGL